MFNVRLAGGRLYGKQLFTWLSLVVSFMASFVLSFFPLDVLDGIWDLNGSVSEGFITYSLLSLNTVNVNIIHKCCAYATHQFCFENHWGRLCDNIRYNFKATL